MIEVLNVGWFCPYFTTKNIIDQLISMAKFGVYQSIAWAPISGADPHRVHACASDSRVSEVHRSFHNKVHGSNLIVQSLHL